MLCDQKISLIIFDENRQKFVSYCSPEFDHSIALQKQKEFENVGKIEFFELKDYDKLKNTQTTNYSNPSDTELKFQPIPPPSCKFPENFEDKNQPENKIQEAQE